MFLYIFIHLSLFKSSAFKPQKPHKLFTVIRIIGISSIVAAFFKVQDKKLCKWHASQKIRYEERTESEFWNKTDNSEFRA